MRFHAIYTALIGYVYVSTILAPANRADDSPLDTLTFMERVRKPQVAECLVVLKGYIRHRPNGAVTQKVPIEIRSHVSANKAQSQLIFNEDARYFVRRDYNPPALTGISAPETSEPLIEDFEFRKFGLHVEDFSYAYLHWTVIAELPGERVRGRRCRVIRLGDPTSNREVTVYIDANYYFPIRVQWPRDGHSGIARDVAFTGFEKINDIWIVNEVKVTSSDWKTLVQFNDNQVTPATPEDPIPEDFFIRSTPK